MAERKQIYKCELCGNIVEVLDGGDGISCLLRSGYDTS